MQSEALKQQKSMFDQQFAEDKRVTDFNMKMAKDAADAQDRSTWEVINDPFNLFGDKAGKLPDWYGGLVVNKW